MHAPDPVPAAAPPCAADPDLWFSRAPADHRRAVSICGTCTARQRCLDQALRQHPVAGVWAGTTPAGRERLLLLAAAGPAADGEHSADTAAATTPRRLATGSVR